LRKLDQPRAPHPTFAHELRAELLGHQTADAQAQPQTVEEDDEAPPAITVLPDTARPKRTARRWLAAAAAILLLIGGGTWFATTQQDNDEIVVSVSPETKRTVEAACAAFNKTAFADVDRFALLGAANQALFADAASARPRIFAVQRALSTFTDDLRAAGIEDEDLLARLEVARGHLAAALGQLDEGDNSGAASAMRNVEPQLNRLERRLTELGVAGCL
jgi:hypothetical protein